METTPEEFFVKGLMEQSPPSPPVFLDLPQKEYNGSCEGWHHAANDMMLPYISRVLLEDNIDDKLNDHPALLQVQQTFSQILSSPSFGANIGNTQGAKDVLHDGSGDGSTLNPSLCKGTDVMQAFLKGMEEASMLLPKENMFGEDEPLNQMARESSNHSGVKKRYNRDGYVEQEVRTTSKSLMVIKEPEENSANEMLDEMMLHAYGTCIRGMDELRLSMDNEVEKGKRKNSRKKAAKDDMVVDICTMLISCAQAVAANNNMGARELLNKIKQHASATGDATQRLAQCFTKALEARLLGTGSQLWHLFMAEPPSIIEFLKAYRLYFAACCFNKVSLIFSTLTIFQAMVGKRKLHIVDYGMQFGFQWAGLLRLLGSREGGPPEVKITAIGPPKPKSCPAERIEEIGCRLNKCANESGYFEYPSPRDTVLNNIAKMRPDIFIHSAVNCSCGSSFLTRFREALFYYMALFDIMDATMPRESKSRLVLEQVVLGRSALNAIACEGLDRVERPEKYRQWQARNQRAGLRQLPLESSIVEVVKDEVKKHHHKDFLICEDGKWLLQGWMGRVLFAHSTWAAQDTSSE